MPAQVRELHRQRPGDGRGAEERASSRRRRRCGRRCWRGRRSSSDLKKQIEIKLTNEGLRIELLESPDSLFFDTGSAKIKAETVRLLGAIAKELSELKNGVVFEGHTDSRPYSTTDGYTNWELSADRANAARRVMEENGLHPGQVREVRGCADTRLRNAKDPLDAQNRRVSIIVANTAALAGGQRPPDSDGKSTAAVTTDQRPPDTDGTSTAALTASQRPPEHGREEVNGRPDTDGSPRPR